MSDSTTEPVENRAQLIAYLTAKRGLGEAELLQVVQLQRAQELGFTDALLALGLATASDIKAARGARHELAPVLAGRASNELLFVREPFHPAAEQVRALRSEILRRQADKTHNGFAIVSSNTADGRSSLAATFAIACAQLGQSTLLIDADLRAARQHQLFNISRGPGLADTLERGIAPAVVGIKELPMLHLLPAGREVSNPLELLCSKPFADLLEGFRQNYRHVLIDTSAALHSADATAVASAAGAALVMSRLHHSSLPASTDLIARLRTAGVRIVGGTVLTAAL